MTGDGSSTRVAIIGGGIAGVSAAWSLHRSGYAVEIFERSPALGGNAKTFRWSVDSGEAESPLLVVAWPEKYYHNYLRLLGELGLETTSMPISYFVKHPQGTFCQDGRTELHRQRAEDFRRWDRLIRITGRINDFFLPKNRHDSLYHFSYWNPLNLVPLYALTRAFGISARFWHEIFVPIHCATTITTSMKNMPAVIAPLVESVVSLERPSRMGTWVDSPRHVFDRMTEPFREGVHTGCNVTAVRRRGGGFEIESADGEVFSADRIVFACQAPSIVAALERPSWLERKLLGRVRYVDDDDPTFSRFVVHSDTSIFPEDQRDRILSEFNTYTEVDEDGRLECTFVLSACNPALKNLGRPMLVTFNSRKPIGKVEAQIELPNATHSLSLGNLTRMMMMRLLQGKRGIHYCGSFTTPEGGHDLSFLSGLVAARSIGADYPFALDDSPAVADYHLMQRMMLGRVLPDVVPHNPQHRE
jgi:predicted NAD/FAD-binding protein